MRLKFCLPLIACAILPPAYAQDPNLARNLAATCANCHGTDGKSVDANESLAGKPKDKILGKLQEFRSGEKPSTVMQQIAAGFSDAQLEMIASYFAARK